MNTMRVDENLWLVQLDSRRRATLPKELRDKHPGGAYSVREDPDGTLHLTPVDVVVERVTR